MERIYIITLKDDKEYAFEDFNLLNKLIAPLPNGSFYFRKVQISKNKPDASDLYLISVVDGQEYAFDDMKLVSKFISPLQNGTFFFRKMPIIKTEAELENITSPNQNQPE